MANRRDKIMFFRAKNMLRKAKRKKNGSHPTILARWKAQESYRSSSAEHNVGEGEIMLLRQSCFGKSLLHSYESWTNAKCTALGSLDKWWRTSTTSTTTPRLCCSKKRMSATTRRVYGGNKAVLQTNSSKQTNASKFESAIRRKWRLWLRWWPENRMEMVQRAAGTLAAHFVFVVLIMAEDFFMAKLEFMVVAFFKAWRRAESDFFFKHAVSDCPNVVPTIRREVYTEYTTVACIMNNTVFSQARTCNEAFGSSVTLVWSPLRFETQLSPCLLMAMAPPSGDVRDVLAHSSDTYDGQSPWRWSPWVTTPTTRLSPGHLSAFRLMTLCLPRP